MTLTSRKTSRRDTFRFKPFSRRQKIVLTWWCKNSAFHDYDGIICDGSIRSGKSLTMSLSFVMWAMETFDNCNFGLCGKTIGSLRRNVINDLKRMLKVRGYDVEDKRSESCLYISRNGRTNLFYLFGGTNEASQDLVQGITLAGALLDEVALMPESFVNQVTARCSVEGSKCWFNCNPGGSRLHWFKQNWINKYKEKRYVYLHFTMDDNLSLSERTKEKYRRMYVGVFYRRYIEGLWVAAEGLIYDMWDDKENSYEESDLPDRVRKKCRRYIAVDYGTTNPMVFLDVLDDGTTFWIQKEYYYDCKKTRERKQKTDYEYANDFVEFVGENRDVTVIIDPSATSFRTELRNRGFHVKEANNDVIDGIRVTASMIKRRRIRALKGQCPCFRKEVETYVWDDKAAQRGEECPTKENDHAMDAIRYLVKTEVKRWRLAM